MKKALTTLTLMAALLTAIICPDVVHGASTRLSWTTPADHDNDHQVIPIKAYEIRYATFPITEENFDSILHYAPGDTITCKAPGEPESFVVTGLEMNTTYYFVIRSWDGENWSPISNVCSKQIRDEVSPDAIINLSCE